MSEQITLKTLVDADDYVKFIELGQELEKKRRAVKDVDGPFVKGNESVWIVYTKDSGTCFNNGIAK